jgi:hypothetical protein
MHHAHRSTAARWAVMTGKILGCIAGCLAVLVVAGAIYLDSQFGGIFSTGRMSGPVSDARVREEYKNIPLVTAAQIAQIDAHMPAKTAFRILGGRSQKIPEETRIKHHWVRTATCYDYPIAGTGHLAHGVTVAHQFEVCISERHNTVASTRMPRRNQGHG